MSPYRILSLDGGGIRGLLTATLLKRIDEAHPGFLSQVDLFSGTSTGGLLALGLAQGQTPVEAIQHYEHYGQKVFSDTLWDEVRDMGSLLGADYATGPLKEVLTQQFADLKLGDLPKKVLISAFDLDNHPDDPTQLRSWKAKFFHNFPGQDSDANQSVVDVALFTSAAPTYFPIYKGYIDGGVVAGNPSLCALAQALHTKTGGQNVEDLVLLSVGTGHNPRFLDSLDGDWGLVQWAPHLIHILMEGSSNLADYQCRQLLGERYLRINPILPRPISMDRVREIPLLREVGQTYPLESAIDWVWRYFE